MNDTDIIFLEDLEFTGQHGWFSHERRLGCRFRLSLSLHCSIRAAAKSDQLEDTIDYGRVAERALEIGRHKSYRLLERLAEEICDTLLREFSIQQVALTLKKLEPPVMGHPSAVGLRISRRKSN